MAERKLVEGIMTYGLAYKPNLIPTSSFFFSFFCKSHMWIHFDIFLCDHTRKFEWSKEM